MRLLTVGEALVDWICTERGAGLDAAGVFTKAAGGAPLNVAVGAARLGVKATFAGRLGDDPFGAWLAALMAAEGVARLLPEPAAGRATRMAYVTTRSDGERQLAWFSRGAADETLTAADLSPERLAAFDALAFGSLVMVAPDARAAVLDAARRVRARGGLALFDPNARPALWPNDATLRAAVEAGLAACNVAKLGDDELAWLEGGVAPAEAAAALRERFDLDAVIATLGAGGALACLRGGRTIAAPGFAVAVVDATGAGDGFVAGLIAGLPAAWRTLDDAGWAGALRQANAVGALACTRAGAIAALPRAAELEAFLRESVTADTPDLM